MGSGELDRAARETLRAIWRAASWYPDFTVGEALRRSALINPTSELVFASSGAQEQTLLWDLHLEGLGIAGALQAKGVGVGDTVVLQAPIGRRTAEVVIGLWSLGAVVVPVAASATPGDLDHICAETGPQLVLDEGNLADLEPQPLSPGPTPRPDEVACVIYTSGSTATPKGVRHSHETLLSGMSIDATPTPCSLGTFPAGHMASVLGLLRPLLSAGTFVMMDRWSARAAVELVEQHRVVSTAGTPFFLATFLDEADRSGRDISSLRRFLCGASPVPPALVDRADAAGIVTWRTYGSTEHPLISSGRAEDPPEKRRATDGRVTSGNEIQILDESGSPVSPGDEGEIISRGPRQFLGYVDAALDVDSFMDATWFRTGDVGRVDDDGYLTITDRAKDVVIRGGENISAREVEEVLAGAPEVSEVAVIAAPDQLWGEVVCAAVVPASETPPTLAALREQAARSGLATHKMPVKLLIVDDLPRTPAGKVLKRDLRRLLDPSP